MVFYPTIFISSFNTEGIRLIIIIITCKLKGTIFAWEDDDGILRTSISTTGKVYIVAGGIRKYHTAD